jgi:hypothetical protein
MPYLQADWTAIGADGHGERIPRGLWIPERDWDGWQLRGGNLRFGPRWREEGVGSAEDPYRFPSPSDAQSLTDGDHEMYLNALGGDLGSVQRDSFFYTNFVEQLKQSPSDATADKVIRTMEELDFASVRWPETVGGPPSHHSPRPWDRVLKWLFGNMAKAGNIILKIADTVAGILIGGGLGVSAVTVSAGVPSPQIGIEVSTELFNGRFWGPIRKFLDEVQAKFVEGL